MEIQRLHLAALDGVHLEAALHRAPDNCRGTVVLAHGITVDMDEGGMFVRLAEQLTSNGFDALRFSYRGHGNSGGMQEGTTIAGEVLDLQAVVEYARARLPGPLSIIAASFGAVSTSLSLAWMRQEVERIVFWNPVLDLHRTFVEPELPWGNENFNSCQQKNLHARGFLFIDGEFRLGRVMFDEFSRYQPGQDFVHDTRPALVVHGDRDSYVSYDIARDSANARPNCDFHTVVGSDHGFDSTEREDEAIKVTVDWLLSGKLDAA
ncbi:alpha/beta hydrolase [Lentzea sp. HUAS12]|uniref:alpha/beta hydrolase n=1 Tax=Lentzea sp. HUAS12 TaxID=2951806 RepID=UPI00209E42A7|nr:alpha/beta fold hydrolase [Lentzea sp. HUAS12]USX56442.1 alpha/beta fold hydrolase [Lentzea sp. HUAS12]